MLDDNKSKPRLFGHMRKKLLKGLQAARRSAQTHDGKGMASLGAGLRG